MKYDPSILAYAPPLRARGNREVVTVIVSFVVFAVTIIMCGYWIALRANQLNELQLLSLECASLLIASSIAIGAAWTVARLGMRHR